MLNIRSIYFIVSTSPCSAYYYPIGSIVSFSPTPSLSTFLFVSLSFYLASSLYGYIISHNVAAICIENKKFYLNFVCKTFATPPPSWLPLACVCLTVPVCALCSLCLIPSNKWLLLSRKSLNNLQNSTGNVSENRAKVS